MTKASAIAPGAGRRYLRVFLVGLALLIAGAAGGTAAAGPGPPGDNMVFFSPSSSGGCGDGVISGIEEGTGTPNVASPSNSPFFQPPGGYFTASGLYASGMAATPYAPGFGGIQSGDWSTQVYFVNSCSGSSQQLLVGCYSLFGIGPAICAQPGGGSGLPYPIWQAWSPPAGQTMGGGVAMDPVSNTLYFTTVGACAGLSEGCQVTLWSAATLTGYGATLAPTAIATLGNLADPDYLAVDPVTDRLFLLGEDFNQVISVSAVNGGGQKVILSGSLTSGGVMGIGVDPTTAIVYVLAAESGFGAQPNQLVQVPESGAAPSVLYGGSNFAGGRSMVSALAVDPWNAAAIIANEQAGSQVAGIANMVGWGSLDAAPGASAQAWFGNTMGSPAVAVRAMAVSDYAPFTAVAAAGTTARASASGVLNVPLSTYATGAGTTAVGGSATSPRRAAVVSGPMVVTIRDRASAPGRQRVYGTLRPGFSVPSNSHGLRRVRLPATALPSLRRGHLEIKVTTRAAGAGQRVRTRVLRVRQTSGR